MFTPENSSETASKLTTSAVDLQKWSGKEISIGYSIIPALIGDAFIAADVLYGDPHGIVRGGGTIFTLAVAGECGQILGRVTEGRKTLPISDFLLPKVVSPIMKGIAHLISPKDKQVMVETILNAQTELTNENLKTLGDLIDISMKIVKTRKVDEERTYRTACLMTRATTGGELDSSGNRFYVKITALEVRNEFPFPDETQGLFIEFIQTGANLEFVNEGWLSLPRNKRFADRYLPDENVDWNVLGELTRDLEDTHNAYGDDMFIKNIRYEWIKEMIGLIKRKQNFVS